MALTKPSLFLRHPKGFVSAVRLACFGLPIVTLTTNKGLKAERVLNCLQKKNFLRSSLTFGNFCDICSPAHSLSLLTLSCLFSLLSQTQTLLASRRQRRSSMCDNWGELPPLQLFLLLSSLPVAVQVCVFLQHSRPSRYTLSTRSSSPCEGISYCKCILATLYKHHVVSQTLMPVFTAAIILHGNLAFVVTFPQQLTPFPTIHCRVPTSLPSYYSPMSNSLKL